jgi:putative MATE family efflux protein
MCVFATLECVATGSIALMGRNLGRGDSRSARHIARSGLALLYAVCLISLPLVIPRVSNTLFSSIGVRGSDELLKLCWLYNMWVPIMLPFMGYTYMANTVFRVQGDMMTPFKAIALANVINIALDPLFIFPFGWGIAGAAIATWVSRIASSLYLIRRLRLASAIELPVFIRPRKRLMSYWRHILWIGVPVGLSTASTALGMGGVNRILSTFGPRMVASWMLGLRVEELASNFMFGINVALTPYIAFNYGKRDEKRMLDGFKAAFIIGIILVGGMGTIIYAYPRAFLSIFRPIPEIAEMASSAIRASVPAYPFTLFMTLSSGFFVGTGYSYFGTISQLLRSIVFRISAAWIFARLFPPSQIWWFQSIAFFLASFVVAFFFIYLYGRIKKEFELTVKAG